MQEKFDVVILSGGQGTRLRDVIGETQKVLVKVNHEPFLLKQLRWLVEQNIGKVILALGYKAADVQRLIADVKIDLRIIPSVETKTLGTGGAVRNALRFVETNTLAVINGDSFVPVDLEDIIRKHKVCDAKITLVIKKMDDVGRYGVVVCNNNDEVEMFIEKSNMLCQEKNLYINTGIYFIQKSEIDKIAKNKNISLEKELLPNYVGNRLFVYKTELPFIDIGTPQSLREAPHFFNLLGGCPRTD